MPGPLLRDRRVEANACVHRDALRLRAAGAAAREPLVRDYPDAAADGDDPGPEEEGAVIWRVCG